MVSQKGDRKRKEKNRTLAESSVKSDFNIVVLLFMAVEQDEL